MNTFSRRLLTLCALGCAALTLQAQTRPSFEFFQTDPFPSNGMAVGDFNRDGKLDLISYTNIALGNGDGTFRPPTSIGTPSDGYIADEVVGDVNGDGKLDVVLVVGDPSGNIGYIDVFYGNGDGTFQNVVANPTAYFPTSVTVGDFNGDGLLDVAVGDVRGNVEIYKNVGGKSFTPFTMIKITSASDEVMMVRAGDIDANGTMDLAASTNTSAYVLWGDGHGNFTPILLGAQNAQQGGVQLDVTDVNQDGSKDVVVWFDCGTPTPVGKGPGEICTDVEIYYGQGNRTTFHRQALIDTANDVRNFAAVDVNGDGIADLVGYIWANHASQSGTAIYLGHPDGSFDQTATVLLGSNANVSMVPGDFNRDGKIDLASLGTIALNATPTAPCATSQINPTVTVCAPVNNTYLTSPFRIQATTDDRTAVTALQNYLDGKLVYNQPVSSFNTTQAASLGSHLLVTKAWDASGLSFRSNRNITIFSGTPGATCPAALNTASLCMPGSTNVTSPVHILGNATTAALPTAAQLYVDNQLVVNNTQPGNTALDMPLTLSSGSHYLVFKVFDANGTSYSAAKSVIVQ